MKRSVNLLAIFILLFATVFLAGCGTKNANLKNKEEASYVFPTQETIAPPKNTAEAMGNLDEATKELEQVSSQIDQSLKEMDADTKQSEEPETF